MTMSVMSAGVACVAAGLAGGAGYNAFRWIEQMRQRARHRDTVRAADGNGAQARAVNGPGDARIIDMLVRQSIVAQRMDAPVSEALMRSPWFQRNARYAGLDGTVSEEGFCLTRVKLAAMGLGVGAIFGALFSVPLAAVLGLVGLYFGAAAPKRAIKHRIDWRTQQMERHLPEMLDVVAIGMRSGLSFDRSLQIYASRFPTFLANEFATAQRKWTSGLERRDEALRQLAASYDSAIFARVMESIIRSIRFGTSMVEGLEDVARESRVAYRTRRQEQVAKAPVKMMIPTGTLILPAMLILVMGPVLLEMVGGGIV